MFWRILIVGTLVGVVYGGFINLAVGGQFPGNPDRSTPFPAEMLIDYVRVYEKIGGYGQLKPRGEGKLPF